MVDKNNNLPRKVFEEIIQTKDIVLVIKKYPNFFGERSVFETIYFLEKGLEDYNPN